MRSYLNKKGIEIKTWKDHVAQKELIKLFLKRYETEIRSRKLQLLTKLTAEGLT